MVPKAGYAPTIDPYQGPVFLLALHGQKSCTVPNRASYRRFPYGEPTTVGLSGFLMGTVTNAVLRTLFPAAGTSGGIRTHNISLLKRAPLPDWTTLAWMPAKVSNLDLLIQSQGSYH